MFKNKGYTLAELLVSIAILSVVMVSIFALMSSTLKTYTISSSEIELQEDAQVVGNQLEELLCDAEKLYPTETITAEDEEGNDYDTGIKYTFESKSEYDEYGNNKLKRYNLKYIYKTVNEDGETEGGILYINVNDSDATLINTGYNILCENVDSFSIDGFNSGNDNVATLKMTVGDDQIDVVRNIHFRNYAEYDAFNNILSVVNTTVEDDDDENEDNTKTLVIKRFENVNLTSALGIIDNIKVKKGENEDYTYFTLNNNFITTSATINSHMDKSIGVGTVTGQPNTDITTDKYTVEGDDIKGNKVVAYLQVKPVKVLDGVASIVDESTNNGCMNNVVVEGIDLYSALSTCDIKCTGQIYKVNRTTSNGVTSFSEVQAASSACNWTFEYNKHNGTVVNYLPCNNDTTNFPGKKVDDYKQDLSFNSGFPMSGENKLPTCVFVDPNTGGFIVTQNSGSYYSSGNKCPNIKNYNNLAIKFVLNIKYKNTSNNTVISTYNTDASYQLINTDKNKL